MDVLAWIGRIGVSPPEAVQVALGLSRPTVWSHLRRLVLAGWLERRPTLKGYTSLLVVTEEGYQRLGFERRMREVRVRPHQWEHVVAMADVAAWLSTHRKVTWWRGEREFGDYPERTWTIEYPGPVKDGVATTVKHRPDIVAELDGKATAIEVELSVKSSARLRATLSAYGLSFDVRDDLDQALYVVGTPQVEAAIRKTLEDVADRVPQVAKVKIGHLETIRETLMNTVAPTGHTGAGGHPEAETRPEIAPPKRTRGRRGRAT
jgi:hypothetical protein